MEVIRFSLRKTNKNSDTLHGSIAIMNFLSILKKLKILTGITKPLNTHFFRKSRSTYLARKGWNELQLGAYQGWVFGSSMPRIYVQMGASDLKKQVLQFT